MSLTGLAFLASYAVGLVLALARHPIYGLATYVAVLFVHPPSRWWGGALPGIRWSLLAALITLTAILVKSSSAQRGSPARHGIFVAYVIFVLWITIQIPWAMLSNLHVGFVILYWKYLLLLFLVYGAVDSDQHVRGFLWAYVCGCFYFGWVAYSTYEGGRFEGFGGPNMGESNAGALALVTGIFAAAPLFLKGRNWERIVLIGMSPFIVNGVITAISRSAFVALLAGGVAYVWYSPKKYRGRIAIVGLLGVVLFGMLTNPYFWARMASLKHAGQGAVVIESDIGSTAVYDAGAGRLKIMQAQWEMFLDHPLGVGHRGTSALSSSYMTDDMLAMSHDGSTRGRSSHNTFFSMLVEQGVLGGAVYIYMLWWMYTRIGRLHRYYRERDNFSAAMVPTLAAILAAIVVGDVFVDYLKNEPRLWFIAIVMLMTDQITRRAPLQTHDDLRLAGHVPEKAEPQR